MEEQKKKTWSEMSSVCQRDRQTDKGQADRTREKQTKGNKADRRRDRQTGGGTDRQTEGQARWEEDRKTDGRTDRQMGGKQTDGGTQTD